MEQLASRMGITLIGSCGTGAFGEVFLGYDQTRRLVAMKVVDKARVGQRWEREFKGLRHYCQKIRSHEHLINIFHVEDCGEHFCYTMEAADNFRGEDTATEDYQADTLAVRISHQRHFTPEAILEIAGGLLDGLEVMHAAGLIHRDVKPDNVMFVGGKAKLMDMGLVTAPEESVSFAGTPGFLPPELVATDTAVPTNDAAGDLYALGKVIYCMLTGLPAKSFPEFPPELLKDRLAVRLNRFLLTACDEDRRRRFHTVSGFRKALQSCNCPAWSLRSWKVACVVGVAVLFMGALCWWMANRSDAYGAGWPFQTSASAEFSCTLKGRLAQAKRRLAQLGDRPVQLPGGVSIEELPEDLEYIKANWETIRVLLRQEQVRRLEEQQAIRNWRKKLDRTRYDAAATEAFKQKILDHFKDPTVRVWRREPWNSPFVQSLILDLKSGKVDPDAVLPENGTVFMKDGGPLLVGLGSLMFGDNPELLRTLLQQGADPDWALLQTSQRILFPHIAVCEGGLDQLEGFLPMAISLAMAEPRMAAEHFDFAVKLILLNHNVMENYGATTALHLAAQLGSLKLVALLLCADAEADARDTSGETPLMIARRYGYDEVEQLLAFAGADASLKSPGATSLEEERKFGAFVRAVRERDLAGVRRLLEDGVPPDYVLPNQKTALQVACRERDEELVELLLKLGANPDFPPLPKVRMGENVSPVPTQPLAIAFSPGTRSLSIFRMLLKNGASPNIPWNAFNGSSTLLGVLCQGIYDVELKFQGDEEVDFLDELLKAQNLPQVKNPFDQYQYCEMVDAALQGRKSEQFVMRLLEVCTDLSDSRSALGALAVREGYSDEVLRVLLEKHAAINLQNKNHWWPEHPALYYAIEQNRPTTVRLLLQNGAELTWRRKDGAECNVWEGVECSPEIRAMLEEAAQAADLMGTKPPEAGQ